MATTIIGTSNDPLETRVLATFLEECAMRFGQPQNFRVSYVVGNVAVNIAIDRFTPPTDEEDAEE